MFGPHVRPAVVLICIFGLVFCQRDRCIFASFLYGLLASGSCCNLSSLALLSDNEGRYRPLLETDADNTPFYYGNGNCHYSTQPHLDLTSY